MRRTYPHNVRGFPRQSWNYRVLQLRHALGWTQGRLAKVMQVGVMAIRKLEWGITTKPSVYTIRKIKALETAYEDILTIYKKHPRRYNRLRRIKRDGVQLLPIEIRRPEDIETLGSVGASTESIFFGRASRRKMQQVGMSVPKKMARAKRSKAISRAIRAKIATGWRAVYKNSKAESG